MPSKFTQALLGVCDTVFPNVTSLLDLAVDGKGNEWADREVADASDGAVEPKPRSDQQADDALCELIRAWPTLGPDARSSILGIARRAHDA